LVTRLKGEIRLAGGEAGTSFARDQFRLLQAIDGAGSISAAARELGISYKTAWDRLERMNNLSAQPLVTRSAGGSQGGGSTLTEHGRQILAGFEALQQRHDDFLDSLGPGLNQIDDLASFVRTSRLSSSAGNQFLGIVRAVEPGAVNAEVTLHVTDTVSLIAIITEQSRLELAIEPGPSLIALVKASSILLSANDNLAISARNVLAGEIARVATGSVNSDVIIDIGAGKTLNAVITNRSTQRMALVEGMPIVACFKASSVILMRL
jgi:molybdate transport system regulatory protein